MKKCSPAAAAARALAVMMAAGTVLSLPTRAQQSTAPVTVLPADVRRVLDNSQRFTVFALGERSRPRDGVPALHGFRILRKREITRGKQKAEIVSAIYRGIADPNAKPRECFNPHHGVRAVQGDKTVDLVICFRCARVQTFWGGSHTIESLISYLPEPALTRATR